MCSSAESYSESSRNVRCSVMRIAASVSGSSANRPSIASLDRSSTSRSVISRFGSKFGLACFKMSWVRNSLTAVAIRADSSAALRARDSPMAEAIERTVAMTSAEATTTAKQRRRETRALVRQLRGDLDWITMRALEKDRARRYGSLSVDGAQTGGFLLLDRPYGFVDHLVPDSVGQPTGE